MALRRIAPGSAVVFVEDPQELRERLRDEEPHGVGAIVGHCSDGVSELNLAAAIAHDGLAREVVLVARGASGSLRSRARRAGVSRVVDATVVVPPQAVLSVDAGEERPRQTAAGAPPAGKGVRGTRGEGARGTAEEERHGVREDGGAAAGAARLSQALTPLGTARDDGDFRKEPEGDGRLTPPRPQGSSPILAVSSGRGGVGKTALVALMAGVAARWGLDVAVVDLDLSCGNLHSCFGVAAAPDLVRIAPEGVPTPESMGRSAVRCNNRVQLWGPCERPEMAELVMPHVATLLSYLSTRFDLVLVDSSTTFTDGVAQAVQSCDRLLVVHDERAGAISCAARVSALAVRLGVARTRIVRVSNLADPRTKASAFEGRAEVGLETARMHRVVDGGIEAEELLAAGKVDELVGIDSALVDGVSALLAQTLAELGRLPENECARRAAVPGARRRRLGLFGRRKEAS